MEGCPPVPNGTFGRGMVEECIPIAIGRNSGRMEERNGGMVEEWVNGRLGETCQGLPCEILLRRCGSATISQGKQNLPARRSMRRRGRVCEGIKVEV